MSYPNAYCVKCGTHTETMDKHTVLLQSNARAVKGVCPKCATDVYKIVPKGKEYVTRIPLTEEEMKKYPDAYCVRCQKHTPTVGAHTVIMENHSRAVTGSCKCCGAEVYRILGKQEQARTVKLPQAAETLKLAPKDNDRRIPVSRRAEEASSTGKWSFIIGALMIAGIISAFVMLVRV